MTSGSPSLANNPRSCQSRRMRDRHDVGIPVCSCPSRSNDGYPKSWTSSPKAVKVKLTNLTAAPIPIPGQRSRSLNGYGSESRCRSFPKNTGSSKNTTYSWLSKDATAPAETTAPSLRGRVPARPRSILKASSETSYPVFKNRAPPFLPYPRAHYFPRKSG